MIFCSNRIIPLCIFLSNQSVERAYWLGWNAFNDFLGTICCNNTHR